MFTTFWLLISAYSLGMLVLVKSLRAAPEGEETEQGFETPWQNCRPDVRDVSLVWVTMPGRS